MMSSEARVYSDSDLSTSATMTTINPICDDLEDIHIETERVNEKSNLFPVNSSTSLATAQSHPSSSSTTTRSYHSNSRSNRDSKAIATMESSSNKSTWATSFINCLWKCLPLDYILLEDDLDEIKKAINSPFSTTVLLLNVMIGSGILVQAYAFMEAGIMLTTLLYIAIGFMNYYSVLVLVRTAEFTGYFDYALIAMTGLGPIGAYAVDTSIVLMDAGSLISYILIIGDLAASVMAVFLGINANTTLYTSETFYSAIITIFIVMPFCLIRRLGHLACISYLAFIVVFFIVFLVCVDGPLSYEYTESEDVLNWFDVDGALDNIGSMVFAMGYTPAVLHAYVSLDDRYKRHFPKITLLSTFLGASLCYITGIVGYLCFRNETDSDILDNFTDTWATATKFLVVFHLIFYIPGDFIVMRSSFYHLLSYSGHRLKTKKRTKRMMRKRQLAKEHARIRLQRMEEEVDDMLLHEDGIDAERQGLLSRGNSGTNSGTDHVDDRSRSHSHGSRDRSRSRSRSRDALLSSVPVYVRDNPTGVSTRASLSTPGYGSLSTSTGIGTQTPSSSSTLNSRDHFDTPDSTVSGGGGLGGHKGSMNVRVFYYHDVEGNEVVIDPKDLGYFRHDMSDDEDEEAESRGHSHTGGDLGDARYSSTTDEVGAGDHIDDSDSQEFSIRNIGEYYGEDGTLPHDDHQHFVYLIENRVLNSDDVVEQDNVQYVITTCVMVLIITFITCVIEYYAGGSSNVLSFVINLTGGLAGSFSTFILPGLCGMAFLHHKPKYFRRSLMVFLFGCIICMCVLVGSFS